MRGFQKHKNTYSCATQYERSKIKEPFERRFLDLSVAEEYLSVTGGVTFDISILWYLLYNTLKSISSVRKGVSAGALVSYDCLVHRSVIFFV
jgi:hypothetical protein